MKEIIATGKTVEEAAENGCRDLGVSMNEVTYEVLEVPVKKLFKSLPAKVKVTLITGDDIEDKVEKTVKETFAAPPEPPAATSQPAAPRAEKENVLEEEPEEPIDLAQNAPAAMAVQYLNEVFTAMGAAQTDIKAFKQGDATLLRVEGDNLMQVLEIKGDTVQALSYLTDRAVNKGVDKKDPGYLRIRLDVAGYRNRRENELVKLAQQTGAEVARTHRSRTLEPMNAYERLIVHTTISKMEGLVSESTGADATRRVVVKSTAADATDGEDWKPPRKAGPGRRDNNRDNNRGGKGNYRQGGGQNRGGGNRRPNDRGDRRGPRQSNTPEREFASRPHNQQSGPVVPERREAIRDGEDLPLYSKIDI